MLRKQQTRSNGHFSAGERGLSKKSVTFKLQVVQYPGQNISRIMKYQGLYTAIVTPFKDGKVDYDAFKALIEAQIAGGVDGIVPMGTTGADSFSLTTWVRRASSAAKYASLG